MSWSAKAWTQRPIPIPEIKKAASTAASDGECDTQCSLPCQRDATHTDAIQPAPACALRATAKPELHIFPTNHVVAGATRVPCQCHAPNIPQLVVGKPYAVGSSSADTICRLLRDPSMSSALARRAVPCRDQPAPELLLIGACPGQAKLSRACCQSAFSRCEAFVAGEMPSASPRRRPARRCPIRRWSVCARRARSIAVYCKE